ncbi:hypothetical protein RH831_08745 [Halodesulfurarchaeum sp. HSR-GB]|uniref:hypothetical protein n=1 Tax=Halodesulfurarchaeum sp. HSR-GB TaxID=3074077 RepID=UPI00285BA3A5|nr:hypothetical protein [Halodesulfurarchaeum sp. HSR-GB]MDR5657267.1 hypothetical protein [Halodesulfurarchaeum sp. HSR-GB]
MTRASMSGVPEEPIELEIVEPSIDREAVQSTGSVGTVAYPYRFYQGTATISRPLLDDRTEKYVVAVDRSRRLTLRADTVPDNIDRRFEDVLVLPSEVTEDHCRDMAEEAVFEWAMRSSMLHGSPEISLEGPRDVYKLFWLAEREDGDVLIDSVEGTERPFED